MTTLTMALLWCVLQVTLLGLLTAGVYLAVRRCSPSSSASVLLAGLVAAACLAVAAASPWPSWARQPTTREAAPSAEADLMAQPTAPPREAASQAFAADFASTPVDSPPAADTLTTPVTPPSAHTPRSAYFEQFLHGFDALLLEGGQDATSRAVPNEQATSASAAWPKFAAALLTFAMVIGVLRFVIGWFAVRRQVARSRVLNVPALDELCASLRRDLGCPQKDKQRPVELRESAELTTAATVGWRRPVILLPQEWGTWSPDERRAVLAHELAHVASGHFAAWLAAQAGLVLHFYHPLIHWLASRLRLEQEYEADALAARVTGGPRPYLETLARLALHQPDTPLGWPARAFLPTRRTFLRRIDMLRNARHPWKPSAITRTLAVALILCGGLFAAGVRGPSNVAISNSDVIKRVTSESAQLAFAEPEERQSSAKTSPDQSIEAAANPAESKDDPPAFYKHFIMARMGGTGLVSDPRRLVDLTDRPDLALSGERFSDDDLLQLANFKRLTGLTFYETGITGSGLSVLSEAGELNHLTLLGPTVTDAWLQHLPPLPSLKRLSLVGNEISDEGLRNLSKFPNLEGLMLRDVPIGDAGLSVLEHLPRLESLTLRPTKATDDGLRYLRHVPNLESLYLEAPHVTGPGLAHVRELDNLTSLNFRGENVTDEWLHTLEPLRNITSLGLNTTQVTSGGMAAIRKWDKLNRLFLNRNPIDDKLVDHLQGLFRLRTIEMHSTPMTPAGVEKLQEALPDALIHSSLKANGDTAEVRNDDAEREAPQQNDQLRQVIDAIEKLGGTYQLDRAASKKQLFSVVLNNSEATDEILELLSREQSLKWLELPNTSITDNGLAHIEKLTDLLVLELRGTAVTDVGLKSLMPLSKLRNFGLQDTGVTLAGLQELWRVNPQVKISDTDRFPPGDPEMARRLLREAGDAAIQARQAAFENHAENVGGDIFKAFQQRSERVRAFRFAWKQSVRHDLGTPGSEDKVLYSQQSSLAVDGRRVSYAYSGLRLLPGTSSDDSDDSSSYRLSNIAYQNRFDGDTDRSLFAYPKSDRLPSGRSQPAGMSSAMIVRYTMPLAWTFRPFDPAMGNLDWTEMKVLKERQLVDGRQCIIFQKSARTEDATGHVQSWWVDPSRDYSIVRYRSGPAGQHPQAEESAPSFLDITLTHAQTDEYGWVPSGWTIEAANGSDSTTTTADVTSFEINPEIAPGEFLLEVE